LVESQSLGVKKKPFSVEKGKQRKDATFDF
jgi:hypothetical protein